MIVKREDGYHVVSEKGKNLGGPYKSKKQAAKRLQQVEYFKHAKESLSNFDTLLLQLHEGVKVKDTKGKKFTQTEAAKELGCSVDDLIFSDKVGKGVWINDNTSEAVPASETKKQLYKGK